jgi:hypothetical protein
MKQKELAQILGISNSHLNNIEVGARVFLLAYVSMLPSEIRGQVIDAALAELQDQADKLESMR